MEIIECKKDKFPIFQERFKILRGDLTQEEFANKIGISRPTVGFYESGERMPDALVLKKISEACEISIDWLFGMSESEDATCTSARLYKVRICFNDGDFISSDCDSLKIVPQSHYEIIQDGEAIRTIPFASVKYTVRINN